MLLNWARASQYIREYIRALKKELVVLFGLPETVTEEEMRAFLHELERLREKEVT
ncbi:MAG TPA: hypothetical protein VN181_00775 [Thermoanaerobaculia bacterium]|nr:hypothetical protein [Thermoanaerobaculia bacterium]